MILLLLSALDPFFFPYLYPLMILILSIFQSDRIHQSGKKDALYKENLLLRGCTIRNTEEAVGIVIYAGQQLPSYRRRHARRSRLGLWLTRRGSAGHETKAMLNNNGPRYKRSKLERQMNVDVFWCVIILLVMCLFAALGMY